MNILGYKLCYILGVPSSILQNDFESVLVLSEQIKYFGDKTTCKFYRAIAQTYFTIVSRYNSYTTNVREVFEDDLTDVFSHMGLSYKQIFSGCENALDFLVRLSKLSSRYVRAAYNELQPGIDYTGFKAIVSLKPLDSDSLRQYHFLLKHEYNYYGVFTPHEVLNVALPRILQSDIAGLIRRASLAAGEPLDGVKDSSALSDTVKQKLDVFYANPAMMEHYDFIILDESKIHESCSRGISSASVNIQDRIIPFRENCSVRAFVDSLCVNNARICLVTKVTSIEELADLLTLKCDIVIEMPIPKRLYRKIITGVYRKIYLFSNKNF